MDGLRDELEKIKELAVDKTRKARLKAFQSMLASLTFLDPACGSGNFLTETYLSLITEGNALRLDWESVVPKHELNYITGNPPFVGYSLQSKGQKRGYFFCLCGLMISEVL